MFRLSSLVTRLAILLLIAAALWIGRDPLIQIAVTRAIESTIGAKVEIGQVRSTLSDNKIFIKDIAIADPRQPMRNLFQADTAVVEFDRDSFLRRRIKIVDGLSSQLVFGSPRLSSGAIHDKPDLSSDSTNVSVSLAHSDPYQNWLDRFQFAPTSIKQSETELAKTANQIFARLSDTIAEHDSKVVNLKTTVREIHDIVNFDDNPLRNRKRLKNAQAQLSNLKHEIDSIGAALTKLDQEIATHKTELKNARSIDLQTVGRLNQRKQLDGETLSRVLLNQDLLEQTELIINWYLAFRDAVPNPPSDFRLGPTYGENIAIPGLSNQAAFFVEQIELDGEGRFAGHKFSFSGEARNITLDPANAELPTTFHLRAQGNTHFAVDCTIDRTQGKKQDNITVQSPGVMLPSRILGHENTMLVKVSPCRSKINISFDCVENQLFGKIDFDYDSLVMQIERLDENAGGHRTAERVNLELGSISNYQVQATISGDIQNPKIAFKSDLGDRFAAKLNPILGSGSQQSISLLDEDLRLHIARLEKDYGERVRLLALQLENEVTQQQRAVVAKLEEKIKNSGEKLFNLR